MPKTRKTAVLRYGGHAANDLFWFILPLVLPLLLTRFGLSYSEAGGIITFYLAISAVSTYLMGRISDGIPRRLMMGFGLWLAAAGLVAAAFAGTYTMFMVWIAVTAIGMSTFHPPMYAHIDETFGMSEDKGRALAVFEVSGAIAIFTMFLVNGALLKSLGARGVMIITAVPALLVGALLLAARAMDEQEAIVEPGDGELPEGDAPEHAPLVFFVLFLLAVVLRFISVTSILNFLPTIFTDHFHLTPDRASWATGLFFAGSIIGSLAAAKFSRPDRSYRVLIFGGLMIAPLTAGMALKAPLGFHLLLVTLLGILGSALLINQNIIVSRLGSRFGRGEAFGIMLAVMTLSSSVAPYLFGMSVDAWDFTTAFLIFTVPVVLSALLLLVMLKRIRPVILT